MSVIYWAGDSTAQMNRIDRYPETGIGQVFDLYLKPEYTVSNHAVDGRSTKSFIDESRLVPIYDKITMGDFLFIQFGHHDEKKEDPSRYTDPFGEYKVNLGKFINVARNKKATPVLITPLERRCFDENGSIGFGAHTEYVAAMKQVAEEQNVLLVDLHSMSRNQLRTLGPDKSKNLYVDATHLTHEGAVLFAGLIANRFNEAGGIYKEMLIK